MVKYYITFKDDDQKLRERTRKRVTPSGRVRENRRHSWAEKFRTI